MKIENNSCSKLKKVWDSDNKCAVVAIGLAVDLHISSDMLQTLKTPVLYYQTHYDIPRFAGKFTT